MRIARLAGQGLSALAAHRLRSLFMMAGTVAGVAALVVIMAIGRGTERKVMERVNNFGPRAIMLDAGGGKQMGPPDMNVTTMTQQDCEAIRSSGIEGLELVTPMAWGVRLPVKREAYQIRAMLWGVEPAWHQSYEWWTSRGETIGEQDVATLARVCLIGQTVAEELFPGEDPLGQRIYVNKVALTVKGVLVERGTSPGGEDFDVRVIVPITTALRRVLNVDHLGAVRVVSRDAALIPRQARALRELMIQRHHIVPPQEEDFRIITPEVVAATARGISRTLSWLLVALASLSLLIGGVVMMNILLVSVGERTREIGLRRALGASQRDIFLQFLAESLTVTLSGMVLGSLAGWLVSLALDRLTALPVVVSWEPFALSLGFALAVGTFFGVQPARRAARLRPVEALR